MTEIGLVLRAQHLTVSCLMQTWCRGKKLWESELLCLDCHHFSWRSYKDPDFKTPEEFERDRWDAIIAGQTSILV